MPADRIAVAQAGIPLADVVAPAAKAAPTRAPRGARAARGARAPRGAQGVRAAERLTGPFLSPGTLSRARRLRLLDGIERVIAGAFTHLPLKRARYGVDPVQRLNILRTQVDELADDAFHYELADIVSRLRDAHTAYTGPADLEDKVAVLPFLVEMIGATAAPTYVVTKVGGGLDPAFKPGVVLEYWNGVPIDRAVQRLSDLGIGGRPDTQRAWAVQNLTFRALQFGPPPDEHWVIVGYRSTDASGTTRGPLKEVRLDWRIVDPQPVSVPDSPGASGRAARALRRRRAVDPAAAAIREAKMLLFAPGALTGKQATAPRRTAARPAPKARVIATRFTKTFKVMSIATPDGNIGYLRIWEFDTEPDDFIAELLRLLPLLPPAGLIVDVRGNPGGYIVAAERALQLFTPAPIQPTRFSILATPFTRAMASVPVLRDEIAPWSDSLHAAIRNGELYSQPLPITSTAECNDLGQHYGGPVVLVADSNTYSAGDLFSAGWVDNGVGPFLTVGEATGAGGANVWDYGDLRPDLVGTEAELPVLPNGIGLTFSFRRATRSGPSEGLPIEDVGIEGAPYAMTRDDLLFSNADLVAHCVEVLRAQPHTLLQVRHSRSRRTLTLTVEGMDCVDVTVDGRPMVAPDIATGEGVVAYPRGTRVVELTGSVGTVVRQRRRILVG